MNSIDPAAITEATDRYNEALSAQQEAKANLDNLNASLTTWRKAFEDAKKILDQAKPTITVAKAQLQKADADVTLAKAVLVALAPEKVAPAGKGADQGKVQAAVRAILLAAAPNGLTLDEIFSKLQAEGVEMGGANPRANLGAYIARWSKVDGSGIKGLGRGSYGFDGPATETPAAVPSFLAPVADVSTDVVPEVPVTPPAADVPAFLSPAEVVPESVDILATEGANDDVLPEGFPGRAALIEAGYDTIGSLTEKTHDQLRRIKGVGAETARNILAALNPEA